MEHARSLFLIKVTCVSLILRTLTKWHIMIMSNEDDDDDDDDDDDNDHVNFEEWGRFRACLRGVGGPQIAEVTCGWSPHQSCKGDQIKNQDYMDRRVTPPKRVTSPTWGSPPHCKPALRSSHSSEFKCLYAQSMILLHEDPSMQILQQRVLLGILPFHHP